MPEVFCSKCGGETEFKKGISKKNNRPYQGFRCLDPNCGNMDFINEEPGVTKEIKEVIMPKPKIDIQIDNSMKSMLMSYAKDIVVAQINQGNITLGVDEVIQDYKKLLSSL